STGPGKTAGVSRCDNSSHAATMDRTETARQANPAPPAQTALRKVRPRSATPASAPVTATTPSRAIPRSVKTAVLRCQNAPRPTGRTTGCAPRSSVGKLRAEGGGVQRLGADQLGTGHRHHLLHELDKSLNDVVVPLPRQ